MPPLNVYCDGFDTFGTSKNCFLLLLSVNYFGEAIRLADCMNLLDCF